MVFLLLLMCRTHKAHFISSSSFPSDSSFSTPFVLLVRRLSLFLCVLLVYGVDYYGMLSLLQATRWLTGVDTSFS